MPIPTWKELDARRQQLSRKLSRAEWARRAGISESTITMGLKGDSVPLKATREKVELVLEAEKMAGEAGL